MCCGLNVNRCGWRSFNPEIWGKTKHYLYLSGYLTFLLTGEFNDSISSQVGYVPFDYKALTWEKKWGGSGK